MSLPALLLTLLWLGVVQGTGPDALATFRSAPVLHRGLAQLRSLLIHPFAAKRCRLACATSPSEISIKASSSVVVSEDRSQRSPAEIGVSFESRS
jgi:hypothetical protein